MTLPKDELNKSQKRHGARVGSGDNGKRKKVSSAEITSWFRVWGIIGQRSKALHGR